jgi:hypothetical protein
MEINLELKTCIIDDESKRWSEIYKITNVINNKIYIGQAVSHVRKHNKLVPHGREGRFVTHLHEALGNNTTKYGCWKLNNAIKKYGKENFTLQILHNCKLEDANVLESQEIINNNSLAPNGYNLTTSCKSFCPSIEFRQNLSSGLINSLQDKRIERIMKYEVNISDNYDTYITPKYRNKIQCGWRIRIRDIVVSNIKILPNKELEFTSPLISLEENKLRAIAFLQNIRELKNGNVAKLTGKSLEPSLPLACGNACEEHD